METWFKNKLKSVRINFSSFTALANQRGLLLVYLNLFVESTVLPVALLAVSQDIIFAHGTIMGIFFSVVLLINRI